MPLLIPSNYADIAIELRAAGDPTPWYITHGVDCTGWSSDAQAIGRAALAAFAGNWVAKLSNIVTVTGCNVTLGSDDGPPNRQFVNMTTGGQGGSNMPKLPQNCALLIRKNTALGGHRNKGRCFLPLVLDEEGVSNIGVIAQGNVDNYQTLATGWLDDLAGPGPDDPGLFMVILHDSEGVSPPGDPTPVTSMTVDTVIATQRGRLR